MAIIDRGPETFMTGRPDLVAYKPVPDFAPALDNQSGPSGTELFENYIALRDQVAGLDKVGGKRLEEIKAKVGAFLTGNDLLEGSYEFYESRRLAEKWTGISGLLREIAPEVHDAEHEATLMYGRTAFKMYGETPKTDTKHEDADASFSFAVPIRMDRNHPEYGAEVESVLPLLRYVPEEMRGQVVKGLPPSIIDIYKRSEDGKRGYLVFTPVYGDEGIDLQESATPVKLAIELLKKGEIPTPKRIKQLGRTMLTGFKERANQRIVDATNFATRRLGADVVGLGAVLPGLSSFGRGLETTHTTTGHGGTVQLILDTLHEVKEQNLGRAAIAKKLGILGLGSIGFSIADVVAQDQLTGTAGTERKLIIYDKDPRKVQKVQKHLAKLGLSGVVEIARDEADLLEQSDVAISAITSKLDLGKLRSKRDGLAGKLGVPGKKPNLKDLVIIDDGQPGSVIREDAESQGVNLVWVLGRGYNGTDELVRSNFRFGVDVKDVFGCEAEVASIAARVRRMRASGATEAEVDSAVAHFAIRGPVNPDLVGRIGELFRENHIGPAALQSYGQPL